MKIGHCLIPLVALFVGVLGLDDLRNFYRDLDTHQLNIAQQPQEANHPKLKKLARCRRYAQNYYNNGRASNSNNCNYSNRCRINYCGYCPTSNCRRRCPPSPARCGSSSAIIISTQSTRRPCNCDPVGSKLASCDPIDGHCVCNPHYSGHRCENCKEHFWKNGTHCLPCNCNQYGSIGPQCSVSGDCYCKSGAGGITCDQCLPKHYGNIQTECKPCDPCDLPGHICHQSSGKCVCPDFTTGTECEKCVDNSWGYEPGLGCKPCACSNEGSSDLQCDRISGTCICKPGYEGEKCDRCSYGFYDYPNCRKCDCDPAGTIREDCKGGTCKCNERGCRCKDNVKGMKCNTCKDGTFGLDPDNPSGCTDCFCFGRSSQCTLSHLAWDQIRTFNITSGLCLENRQSECWVLPDKFTGDLTKSYGGFLRIPTNSILQVSYNVYITGNGATIVRESKESEIKVTEHSWRSVAEFSGSLPQSCHHSMSRQCLLAVLQNVTTFKIEPVSNLHSISEIVLDKATHIPGSSNKALTVEQCVCPKEYKSLSCQDPSEGFYRYYPRKSDNFIDQMVGIARPCHCNNKTNHCHPDTGHCLNCSDFTTGINCERCAQGYYKSAFGNCQPCLCPSEKQNFAKTCSVQGKSALRFVCDCQPGYAGEKCDKCQDGFWGDPLEDGGMCEQCKCNPYGSKSSICQKTSGFCECLPGFTGMHCSQCISERQVIQNGVCTPCDECTQILFDTIDDLGQGLDNALLLFKDGLGPPWKIFNTTLSQYTFLSKKFNDTFNKAQDLVGKTNVTFLENRVKHLKRELNKKNQIVTEQISTIDELYKNSGVVTKQVEDLARKIEEVIENLNKVGSAHVDTKEALREAKQILNEIIERSNDVATPQEYNDFFNECKRVHKEVNAIYNDHDLNPAKIKTALNDLKKRIGDMNQILEQTNLQTKLTKNKNKQNALRISNLNKTIAEINAKNTILISESNELLQKINNTNDILNDIEQLYEELLEIDLDLAGKGLDSDEDPELYDILASVSKHVKYLQDKVKHYQTLLNFTPDEWKKINASSAYDNLVKGVNEAKKIAEQAQNITVETMKLLFRSDDDSLPDKTSLALAFSDRLQKRVLNLKNPKSEFRNSLNDLDKLRYNILQNGKKNNELITTLDGMRDQIENQSKSLGKQIEKVKSDAANISDSMAKLQQKVRDMNISTQYELIKDYQQYLHLVNEEDITKLREKISSTRLELQNVDFALYVDKIRKVNDDTFKNSEKNLNDFQSNVEMLKRKIQYAKQLSETVSIPLSLANCQREYHLPPSVFQSLSISYECSSCLLFNLQNSKNESILIRVKNERILLKWRKEERKIQNHNRTLSLVRIGNRLILDNELDAKQEIVDPNLFVIDESSVLKIGRADHTSEGCLHDVIFNGKPIGLWKFHNTKGECTGCLNNNATQQDVTNFQLLFNGKGYSDITSLTKDFSPSSIHMQFNIATFDEDSLIFLAQDITSPTCSYIALYLNEGHLEFAMRHVDGTNVTLTSPKKYNHGNKTIIKLIATYDMQKQHYQLVEEQNTIVQDERMLGKSSKFRIKKSKVFLGGVPPIFDQMCGSFTNRSFLGIIDLKKNLPSSYGAQSYVGELKLDKAWFNGHGFLELDTNVNLNTDLQINFLLSPVTPNGFVMSFGRVYEIYMRNNRLVVTIGGEERTMDGDLTQDNVIELIITDKSFSVRLNNNTQNMDVNRVAQNSKESLVFHFGSDKRSIQPNFTGGLSDIVVNDRKISFDHNTVKKFHAVEIGREYAPLSQPITMKNAFGSLYESNSIEMQNTEGCAVTQSQQIEMDAVKFGDEEHSFLVIENNFWKKDYVVEFDFKTLYSNGLLLLSIGAHQEKQFNILEVQDGKIRLRAKGKRTKSVILSEKINDGEWHRVAMKQSGLKKKRKFSIVLDGVLAKKPMRLPKNNVRNELYVGGIPENFSDHLDLKSQLHQFRGCIRSFSINNVSQIVEKNKRAHSNNVGKCFSNTEEGAYFAGDAYAIYKSDFKVNKVLELSFQFRTVEQNGILLSVSNQGNSPALSVELQNGAVVMTIDMGNGAISKVKNSLDSDFILCNNKWHNITAMYSSSELTVNVDGIRKSWVQSDINSLMDEIEAPLYIGGLPENAPSGTLKIKENFRGCIRKLTIENSLMDWTDMKELKHVLLNSCPVST